jgi:hypothetical protein
MDQIGLNQFFSIYEMMLAKPYTNIFVGIPYFALGRYFARKTRNGNSSCIISDSWNCKKAVLSVLVSMFFLLCEVAFTLKYQTAKATDCYFMLFICTAALMNLFLHIEVTVKRPLLLRMYSTIQFFSHFLWLFLCEVCEWVFEITVPSMSKFLVALLGGSIMTIVIIVFEKQVKWLRNFY